MFGRQWFDRDSQAGLHPAAMQLEHHLHSHNYQRFWHDIAQYESILPRSYLIRQAHRVNRISTRANKQPISFYFTGFWPRFDPLNSYLWHLLAKVCSELQLSPLIISDSSSADITISSCFPGSLLPCDQSTRIIYLGENVRPFYSEYDYSLTTDLADYNGRNSYLPVWLMYMFESTNKLPFNVGIQSRITEFARMYRLDHIPWDRRECSFVYIGNNCEPLRISMLYELMRNGFKVKTYGSQSRPVESKSEVYGRVKFVLCPENSYSPGYVTEKLIDGLFSGANIIYYGGLSPDLLNVAPEQLYIWSPSVDNPSRIVERFVKSDQPMFSHHTEQIIGNTAVNLELKACKFLSKVLSLYA